MSKQISLKKNYAYKLLYEVLAIIIPFITTPYVSRVLGADGVGTYSYTQSIVTYFTLFAGLGTISYGAREIARCRDDVQKCSKTFWEIELLSILTSVICLVIWLVLCIIDRSYTVYFLALTPFILGTMVNIAWFFTGKELVGYTVLRNSLIKILGLILIFIFVKSKEDLLIYFLINSLSNLFANLSMWMYLPKFLVKVDFRTLKIKNHFKETLVYFIPTIATSIYTVLDKTLIGVIVGDNYENGYYEQAYKIVSIIKTCVFVAFNSMMSVRISYLFGKNNLKEIHERIEKSFGFIFMLGFGATLGLVSVAKDFIPIFLGSGYEATIGIIYLMSPLIIIIGISNCLGNQYYTPCGRRKFSAKIIIFGSIINLICNLVLIPFWGARGATVGSVIAETYIAVRYVNNCDGYITWKKLYLISRKKIVAAVVMTLMIFAFNCLTNFTGVFKLVFDVLVGGMCYIIFLYVAKDDTLLYVLNYVKKSLRRFTVKNG